MNITGTNIHYFMVCKRKLWISLHHINMEQFNEDVGVGKVIEETSYERRSEKHKQVLLENIKVDFIDVKKKVLHETKKSSKNIDSAIMQMKYYLYIIGDSYTGLIEIPTERFKQVVVLTNDDKAEIERMILDINKIYNGKCPIIEKDVMFCEKCSFFDFCYS